MSSKTLPALGLAILFVGLAYLAFAPTERVRGDAPRESEDQAEPRDADQANLGAEAPASVDAGAPALDRRAAVLAWGAIGSTDPGGFQAQQPRVARIARAPVLPGVESAWVEAQVESGRYRFDPFPGDWGANTIVALHPGHTARAFGFTGAHSLPDIVLEPAPTLEALVLDEAEDPIEGALVSYRGTLELSSSESLPIDLSAQTNSAGVAELYPLPGEFQVSATHLGLESRLWRGTNADAQGRIRLILAPEFSAVGRVTGAPGADYRDFKVTARVFANPLNDPLAETAVGVDGTFELPAIPWRGPGEYILRMTGPTTCPMERSLPVERAGEQVSAEFACREGLSFNFQIEHDGSPVPGAEVTPYWWEHGAWTLAGRQVTDENGQVHCTDLLPGALRLRVAKEGFAETMFGPWDVLESREKPAVLEIEVGSRVGGRVTYRGEPVRDFEVRAWDQDHKWVSRSFKNREDGRFTLEGLRQGPVEINALSGDQPPCEPLKLEVIPGEEAWVELELTDAHRLSGRVLDVSSGLPISGARIAVWATTSARKYLGPWGQPTRTGSNGRFEDLPIPAALGVLIVSAEGYEKVVEFELGPNSASRDIGTVGLARLQDLEVRLLAPEGHDFTGYRVRADGTAEGKMLDMDPSGRLVIEDMDSGSCRVNVFPPGGGRMETDVDLVAGQGWSVVVPVATERGIVFNVRASPGFQLPESCWVRGAFRAPSGSTYSGYAKVDGSGYAEISFVYGDQFLFEVVHGGTGDPIATRAAELNPSGVTNVTVEVSGRSIRFLLTDGEGTPLPTTFVMVWMTGDPTGFRFNTWTDAQGELLLTDFGSGRLSMVIQSVEHTSRERVIDQAGLEDRQQPIVLRFDTTSSVRLLLMEDDQPAANVRAGLRPSGVQTVTKHKTSDGAGEILYGGLEQGAYEVNVQGNGWFPVVFEAEAAPDPTPRVVQVRRRGSLELRFSQGGVPVAGAGVELVGLAPGDDVPAWLAAGLISADPVDLKTGPDGTLRFSGLPTGDYRISATSTDGSRTVEGQGRVVGAALSTVPVVFP
jgi:hypothetical protein